jgi:hypothetical protein
MTAAPMEPRSAESLRWRCPACEALVDERHPSTYRCADGAHAHTYDDPDTYGDYFSPPLAELLPIDDGTVRTPLDVRDVAVLLNVKPDTVHKWRTRGVLPPEDGRVSDQPWWWPITIDGWATETRRWPGYVQEE